MKRIAIFLLSTLLLAGLFGCSDSASKEFKEPVTFYYCTDLDSNDNFDNIFIQEMREGYTFSNDRVPLLNEYLSGPVTEGAVSPFPVNLVVLSAEQEATTVYILLSEHMTSLSGLELTLACACLSQTIFDIYDCSSVEIRTENGSIDGQECIRLERNSMIFSDIASPHSEG